MNRKLKDIPPDVRQFAMRITSHPDNHSSYKACNAWIDKERKKFANEIMDLFETIKKEDKNKPEFDGLNEIIPPEKLKEWNG